MVTELTKLISNLSTTKKTLQNFKNKYFNIIYDGALKNKPVSQIHKELFDATINKKPLPPENKTLLTFAVHLTNRVKKIDATGGLDILAVAIIQLFMKQAVNYKANIIINTGIREKEDKDKTTIINTAVDYGRETGKIFYVASSHNDCAKDHLPYQGKIYVDEGYKQFDTDGKIEKYVKAHGIKTMQWVTDKPVYFLTRPHCRHYFVQYSFDDIVTMNYKVPYRKIGYRKYQTKSHGSYEYYKDRYEMLRELYKTYPTKTLKNLLLKTKILKDKWYKQTINE